MQGEELAIADRDACRTCRPAGTRLLGALVVLCGVLALGACGSNQSGVRDWSLQAREAVLPPALTRPAPDGVDSGRAAEEAMLVLREAAGAWLATLASAAAVNLVRATAFVSQRGWGAGHLAHAVDYGDPFFQAALTAIARQAPASRPAQEATMARIGAGHALLFERRFILGQSDTGRRMRMEASELRRLSAAAATAP
jgi:hypothetical protein